MKLSIVNYSFIFSSCFTTKESSSIFFIFFFEKYVIGDDYTSFDWKVFSLAILSTQPKRFVLTDEEVRIAQFFDRYGKKYPKDYLYFNLYKSRGLKETL